MPTNSFSPGHLRRGLLFVLSAAAVAGVFHVALRHPLLLGSLLLVWWLAHQTRQYLARRKLQALLDSGDVTRLLEVWEGVPTTEPRARAAERLLRATALASYGWTARARQLLSINELGPALNDATEHRVFLELLLASLEGEHERALAMAAALQALPLPERRALRSRAKTQRAGAAALARAFARRGKPGDTVRLRKASRQNPLLLWPMRYAEAQLSLQRGDARRAEALIKTAPAWPEQSVFRQLTEALRERVAVHS